MYVMFLNMQLCKSFMNLCEIFGEIPIKFDCTFSHGIATQQIVDRNISPSDIVLNLLLFLTLLIEDPSLSSVVDRQHQFAVPGEDMHEGG